MLFRLVITLEALNVDYLDVLRIVQVILFPVYLAISLLPLQLNSFGQLKRCASLFFSYLILSFSLLFFSIFVSLI